MDAADLKRKLAARREFDVSQGGVTLVIRLPTETVMRACVASMRNTDALSELQRPVMERSVVGWRGIRACDLDLEGEGLPETPVEFDASLLEEVFDRWPDLYDRAYSQVMDRYNARLDRLEAERKNLQTMSAPT